MAPRRSSTKVLLAASVGLVLVALGQSVGAYPSLGAGENVMSQAQYRARTDPELNAEALSSHQLRRHLLSRFARSAGVARKIQQLNNEADVAALLGQPPLKHPLGAPQYPAQAASHLQQQQTQLAEDEQSIKRQLHELIAQAPNDKSIERALLRMVINASLRNALSSMAAPQHSSGAIRRDNTYDANLQQLDGSFDNGASNAFDSAPHLSARLEQAIGDYANIDPNDLGQSLSLLDPASYQASSIDKREYIKPCSFNALSCARNPIRRPS